jgi:hypothetical protein
MEVCIGGGGGRGGTSEAEVEVVETEEAGEEEAAEAEGCIGGSGMHWKHRNASEVHRGVRS